MSTAALQIWGIEDSRTVLLSRVAWITGIVNLVFLHLIDRVLPGEIFIAFGVAGKRLICVWIFRQTVIKAGSIDSAFIQH